MGRGTLFLFSPAACAVALLLCSTASAQVPGKSETCGPVNGKTRKDVDNILKFCAASVSKEFAEGVEGAIAMDSLLWIKVTRQMASAMRADRLSTEQLIKVWMNGWKRLSGRKAVAVTVEWKDVTIVEGQTTLLSGDKVTFR